jgi:Fur family ferric uptake transcriptional regulator
MLIAMNDYFRRELQRRQLKLTPPRRLVFEALQNGGPLTMSELIRRTQPAVDRASVYRTVARFEQIEILHHLIVGGRKVIELTERFTGHHHHLSCVRCGQLQDVHDEPLEAALQRLADTHGFDAHNHVIEVSGVCRACATQAAA